MKSFLPFLFFLICSPAFSQSSRIDTLLHRIDSVYANASTYRDHGEVEISYKSGIGRHSQVKPFKTVFDRNRLFRFSYHNKSESLSFYGFQWDSTGIIHGFSFMKSWKRDDGDFASCAAGATGVSGGSGHTVPRLLMPGKITGRHVLHGYGPVRLAGMKSIDGQNCYLLSFGDSLKPVIKIWVDQDSLLIRQIIDSYMGSVTRYHPEINRPIPDPDRVFKGRKENLAVFWSIAPIKYALVFLIVIILIGLGINRLIDQRKSKNGIQTARLKSSRFPHLERSLASILIWIFAASQMIGVWFEPGESFLIILIGIPLALILLVTQYLRPPDWIFKNHRLYFNVFFLVFTLGITGLAISFTKAEFAALAGWILPAAVILALYFLVVLIVQNRKWKRLKDLTPCPGEETGTISAAAGLLNSADEEDSSSNSGRILLFHDRLVFVAKDGALTPILLQDIQNIRVHRVWLVVPAGLELTDSSGHSIFLVVGMPYFWKSKIKA